MSFLYVKTGLKGDPFNVQGGYLGPVGSLKLEKGSMCRLLHEDGSCHFIHGPCEIIDVNNLNIKKVIGAMMYTLEEDEHSVAAISKPSNIKLLAKATKLDELPREDNTLFVKEGYVAVIYGGPQVNAFTHNITVIGPAELVSFRKHGLDRIKIAKFTTGIKSLERKERVTRENRPYNLENPIDEETELIRGEKGKLMYFRSESTDKDKDEVGYYIPSRLHTRGPKGASRMLQELNRDNADIPSATREETFKPTKRDLPKAGVYEQQQQAIQEDSQSSWKIFVIIIIIMLIVVVSMIYSTFKKEEQPDIPLSA